MSPLRFHHQPNERVLRRPSVCPICDGPLIRRDDDEAAVLQTRLAEFKSKTEPLLSFYEKDDALHRIDGNRDRDAVFADISALIEEREK
jgi:adenylate kinase